MRAQLKRAGTPGPKAIGIDQVSIRKGHTYRIVVSDLIRRRPIWFGGEYRSAASMRQFYDWLGENRVKSIRLAVMDLGTDSRKALKNLLKANKRLNTAYLLKESFGQLWEYRHERWARRFFEHWCDSLKWQRLPSHVKFAEMIDRHWDGIAAYCKAENKVSLGFVERLNNKICVIQCRA